MNFYYNLYLNQWRTVISIKIKNQCLNFICDYRHRDIYIKSFIKIAHIKKLTLNC